MKYALYGLTIESDVQFIQLSAADDKNNTDVRIMQGECAKEVTDYLGACYPLY